MSEKEPLPIAIIGAGPVGLAAAAELLSRGERPIVFERGARVGSAVSEWGQVRVFSPWRYCVDPAAKALLGRAGWLEPDADSYPTGRELVDEYLLPLAALPEFEGLVRVGTTVTAITRSGMDRMTSAGRETQPFALRIDTADGPGTILVRAVIDASGTWTSPNPLGAEGLAALGEPAAAARIHYGIPDVLGAQRDRYAGRRVLVVGRGHSAFNTLLDLATLRSQVAATEIIWATRKPLSQGAFGGGSDDGLPERGRLGAAVQILVQGGAAELLESFAVARLDLLPDGVRVSAQDGRQVTVDEVISNTGFRPDLALTSELRLSLDEIVEAPRALAPLIDPNLHSCGTVPPHGEAELAHPEKDFYVVGMKSYGRAPTFLMLTGYEQVRSIACALTGDREGARRVELVLPETGVCSTAPPQPAFGGKLLQVLQVAPSPGSCCG